MSRRCRFGWLGTDERYRDKRGRVAFSITLIVTSHQASDIARSTHFTDAHVGRKAAADAVPRVGVGVGVGDSGQQDVVAVMNSWLHGKNGKGGRTTTGRRSDKVLGIGNERAALNGDGAGPEFVGGFEDERRRVARTLEDALGRAE
jgi:hypothetical protein